MVNASYSVTGLTCEPRKGCFVTGSGPDAAGLGSLLLQGMSQQDRSFASRVAWKVSHCAARPSFSRRWRGENALLADAASSSVLAVR